MSHFYVLEPEVAGGLGPNTEMDRSAHPPNVSKLHYVFDGWLGDEIVESFPCFLVTKSLSRKLAAARLSGVAFDQAEVSASELFRDRQPDRRLPEFIWLKVLGKAGLDDFGLAPDHRLVVSSRALGVINTTGPSALDVESFEETDP